MCVPHTDTAHLQPASTTTEGRTVSNMPSYKVTYFNARGRAEVIRLALAAAGQPFEDVRLESEQWKALKGTLSQGMLPILEVDGKIIAQSGAILRHVGREHDLYGNNNIEKTFVDVVIETTEDFNKEAVKTFFEKDPTKKAELLTKLLAEKVPWYLTILEKMLEKREWMVGSQLSIADLVVYNTLEFITAVAKDQKGTDILEGKPTLKAHFDRVKNVPAIKAWLDKRPKTDH